MTDAAAAEAFHGAACGLLTLDAKGKIERANRRIADWVGIAATALVGRPFQDLFTIGSKLFLQTQWWPLLEMQESVAEVQLELVTTSAHPAPVLVNAARREDRRIDVALMIAKDRRKYERELLLARRRAEELLAALQEAERATKQRAMFAEQLIGIVSHDLRNPLNAILLGTHLLATADDSKRVATTRRIASAAERATRLTAELLDFTQARLGTGLRVVKSEIDLHAVVGETVEELRMAWPERELTHEKTGGGTGLADADRLAQVVTNLVGNAFAYGTKEAPVRVASVIAAETMAIRVTNRGRPLAPELREAIFEPLQRGEEQVQRGSRSVGLGLYIVREIARAHGGEARVLATDDEELTTFEVVFGREPA